MRTPLSLLIGWLLIGLLANGAQSALGAEGPRKPTAAFIDFDRSPIGTLLESQLLEREDIVWLERADIDKVVAERRIQALFAPEGGSERAKMGRLLKADLLILLRTFKQENSQYIDLVIAEVSRGLRLARRSLPVSPKTEADVQDLLQVVQSGFQKSRADLRAIFAVPPFLNHDLVFEHDHLRGAYARLIEQQLLDQPQILVVELAEADALTRERALDESGDKIARIMPHFLLGEFHNEGKEQGRRIKITLRLKQGQQLKGDSTATLVPDQAPAYLHEKVAAVLKFATGAPPAPSDTQTEAKQLAQRATECFARMAWGDAVALAEASLFCNPDQPELHLLAIRSLAKLAHLSSLQDASKMRVSLAHYLRGLDHLSALHLKSNDFASWQVFGEAAPLNQLLGVVNHLQIRDEYSPEMKALLREVQAESRSRLLALVDLVIGEYPAMAAGYVTRASYELSPEEIAQLRSTVILKHQERPNAKEIALQLGSFNNVLTTPAGSLLLDRLDAQGNDKVKDAVIGLRWLRERQLKEIAARKNAPPLAPSRPVPADRLPPAPAGATRVEFEPLKLHFVGDNGAAEELGRLSGWIATKHDCDLIWSEGDVFILPRGGELRRVRKRQTTDGPNSGFAGIGFDGRYIWAPLAAQLKTTRLIIIDATTGKEWELTNAHGVPDPRTGFTGQFIRQEIQVAPLAEGKALILGSFVRAWIGVVTIDPETGPALKIVYEMPESRHPSQPEQWRSSKVGFSPSDLFTLEGSAGDSATRVCVLRKNGDSETLRHPLLIDPSTLSVEVMLDPFPGNLIPMSLLSFRGETARHFGNALYVIEPVPPAYKAISLTRLSVPGPQVETVCKLPADGYLLAEEKQVHVIGQQWWIVDLETKAVTPAGAVPWVYSPRFLGPHPIEKHDEDTPELLYLGRSHRYGVVAMYETRRAGSTLVRVKFVK